MDFTGKWAFKGQDGNYILLDTSTTQLKTGPQSTDKNENFNAYGTNTAFIFQANNGKYAETSGDGYKADLARTGNINYFALESAGGNSYRIVDLGPGGTGTTQYYLNSINGSIQRIEKSTNPPATTLFTQTIVTVGYSQFKKTGFTTAKPDMSWVYLSGLDLTGPAYQTTDFTNADLSNVILTGTRMQASTFTNTNLSGATIKNSADLTGAKLVGANLTNADMSYSYLNSTTLTGATLTGAKMVKTQLNNVIYSSATSKTTAKNVDMTNAYLSNADFTAADLTGSILTGASMKNINFIDTNLTNVTMSNPAPPAAATIDLSDSKISSKTYFNGTKMRYVDLRNHDLQNNVFTYADLTGSKLDNTKLNGAELSYATLDYATLTGNIPMFGANLSNASLTGADLTGAQMGAISLLFRVSNADQVNSFKTALNNNDVAAVTQVFKDNGVTLVGVVTITASTYAPGSVWEVKDSQTTYTVRLEQVNGADTLAVYTAATAAVLSNVFLKDAILTSANLYNCRGAGAQIFGTAKLDGNAILERAIFDNSNMGNLNLKQAKLYGVILDYATLTGAQFDGAFLKPDAGGGQASLSHANLQGASFTDTQLDYAIFTDAAVSVARTEGSTDIDGVWLFSDAEDQNIISELNLCGNPDQQLTLDPLLKQFLTAGPVQTQVRQAFADYGITLGTNAVCTILLNGPYWTITDGSTIYDIIQACDKKTYTPALGVSKEPDPTMLFTLPYYLEDDLQNGPVDQAIRDAFFAKGISLGTSAYVTALQTPTDWQIIDTPTSYSLWIGLDPYCNLSISARPSMPNILSLFSEHSMPLTYRATVYLPEAGRWELDNDSNNPYNPVTNYIKFNISDSTEDKALDIYGSMLRILQLNPSGESEYKNIRCDQTVLPQNLLKDNTVCPNSQRTQVNIQQGLPYKKWMRARVLPKPPYCIPSADGMYYCPQKPPSRELSQKEKDYFDGLKQAKPKTK